MDLEQLVETYSKNGYSVGAAKAKVFQDIILLKICNSSFKENVTIKGGVVMHTLSCSKRRATRDLDLDFIKYSLDDVSIISFVNKLSVLPDKIRVNIIGNIKPLHHQDYHGKRVMIELIDSNDYKLKSKIDIGVHKLLEIKQEEIYFNINANDYAVCLLANSCEQIFVEKVKALLIMGVRSTRYKDVFDIYFFIKENRLDKNVLLETLKVIVFSDESVRENDIDSVYLRLFQILNSKIYKRKLLDPKCNWLDVDIEYAINIILNYIKEL